MRHQHGINWDDSVCLKGPHE